MIHNIITALESLRPGSQWVMRGDSYSNLDWMPDNQQSRPTEQEIQDEINRLNAAEPMKLLREERDKKLAETDWWALADRVMTSEQTAYRQALRDITLNATPSMVTEGMPHMIGKLDPNSVTWPVKP